MSWRDGAKEELGLLGASGLLRGLHDFDGAGPRGAYRGRDVVSFASNDYLGLASDPEVVDAAIHALARWGAGSGAARLITGTRPVHSELERELAHLKGAERALLFSSGYAANCGVLAALGRADVLICSDELNHASIVDGCRLARARVAVYPHCDMAALEYLLSGAARAIVVSDAVFSMDGDVAPVDDLASLCFRHGALLVLDEAHSVLGPEPALDGLDAIRIGTCSKTLGASGGFAAGPSELIELVVNRARSFIFTTAPPPADAAAALAAVAVLTSERGAALVSRLRALVDRIRPGHPSPIIPVVLGDERAALAAHERLLEHGVLVPAIRPPSVPPGSARLRVTLSAAHTGDEVELLASALDNAVPGWRS